MIAATREELIRIVKNEKNPITIQIDDEIRKIDKAVLLLSVI